MHHGPGGLACLPHVQGETAALCRASQAVVSGAAQFRCAEGGACPQINESGAKIPFNVLCQGLGSEVPLMPEFRLVWCWAVAEKMLLSASPAPAGEQCSLWLEVTLEGSFHCLLC